MFATQIGSVTYEAESVLVTGTNVAKAPRGSGWVSDATSRTGCGRSASLLPIAQGFIPGGRHFLGLNGQEWSNQEIPSG